MSLLGKATLFALREFSRPTLEEFGKEVGTALGKRLAGRIGAKSTQPAPTETSANAPSSEHEEHDPGDEDERTR
ncbi:MAG: hypothetical protein ACTHU0_19955 [Kofleriaceae bacterium]